MPKLFEYLGIIILFYSSEHEPIHVHGKYQGRESKAEIIIENGEVIEVRLTDVKGKRPLEARQLKDFETFVTHYAKDIVEMWIDFFVLHKPIESRIISRRLKS